MILLSMILRYECRLLSRHKNTTKKNGPHLKLAFHGFFIHIKENDNNIGYYIFVLIESPSSATFFVCYKEK